MSRLQVPSVRRRDGEIVRRIPGSGFVGSSDPVYVWLVPGEREDMGCMLCEDDDCAEWTDVLAVTGPYAGFPLCHISECEMRDFDGPGGRLHPVPDPPIVLAWGMIGETHDAWREFAGSLPRGNELLHIMRDAGTGALRALYPLPDKPGYGYSRYFLRGDPTEYETEAALRVVLYAQVRAHVDAEIADVEALLAATRAWQADTGDFSAELTAGSLEARLGFLHAERERLG